MPPVDRFVTRFAAEPPQEGLPYGRWADRLRHEFLGACLRVEPDEEHGDLGEPGDIVWFPDRTWDGRTYVPATTRTANGFELFGYVSFTPGDEDTEPDHFRAWADYTDVLAEKNPDWKMDLNDEVLGGWRGEQGKVAAMTLVWGRPLLDNGHVVTAELADLAVDQCTLVENRFTLIAPDDYRGDTLDVKLWDARGTELAAESLYE
jgi:hypothetical protein